VSAVFAAPNPAQAAADLLAATRPPDH
jgi:hypothetical protein